MFSAKVGTSSWHLLNDKKLANAEAIYLYLFSMLNGAISTHSLPQLIYDTEVAEKLVRDFAKVNFCKGWQNSLSFF